MQRPPEPSVTDEVSLDETYLILSHPRRRHVLTFLEEHGSTILPDLAAFVACRENNRPLHTIGEEEIDSVRASLWHVHVPKLEDAGFIEFDRANEEVALVEDDEPVPIPGLPAYDHEHL